MKEREHFRRRADSDNISACNKEQTLHMKKQGS